jgi:hypothetical protein
MRFITPRATRGTRVKKSAFKFETNIKGNIVKPGQQIILTSATPFRQPDTSRIRFYQVLDSLKEKVVYSLIRDSSNSCRYILKSDLLEDSKYLFIADSASFGDIYNENSDSVGVSIALKKSDSYGKLTLAIRNCIGNCIIQLLDSKEKLISETAIKADGKVVFPLLDAGVYRLKVIYDLDGDGKWTTGDFNKGRQPEPVSYYSQELDIKTGWEIDQDWDIGKQLTKEGKLKQKRTSKSTTKR